MNTIINMPNGKLASFSVNKTWVLFTCLFLSSLTSQGQQWIHGYVRDSISESPIANARVATPLGSTLTNDKGYFTLLLVDGETIVASAAKYLFRDVQFFFKKYDTAFVINLEPLGHALQNLTISSSLSAYQVDSTRRRNEFERQVSKTTAISTLKHEGFGIVINLDHFTKDKDKHIKKQWKLFERTEEWAYVRSRFPDSLVKYYTGLTGEDLQTFMYRYTPSYKWLRKHTSRDEVFVYINEKIKLFRKEKQAPKTL